MINNLDKKAWLDNHGNFRKMITTSIGWTVIWASEPTGRTFIITGSCKEDKHVKTFRIISNMLFEICNQLD